MEHIAIATLFAAVMTVFALLIWRDLVARRRQLKELKAMHDEWRHERHSRVHGHTVQHAEQAQLWIRLQRERDAKIAEDYAEALAMHAVESARLGGGL